MKYSDWMQNEKDAVFGFDWIFLLLLLFSYIFVILKSLWNQIKYNILIITQEQRKTHFKKSDKIKRLKLIWLDL